MQDKNLIEPFIVQEFFVDGFANFYVDAGVLRCIGYRVQPSTKPGGDPLRIAVLRMVVPTGGAFEAAEATKQAVIASPTPGLVIARGRLLS